MPGKGYIDEQGIQEKVRTNTKCHDDKELT